MLKLTAFTFPLRAASSTRSADSLGGHGQWLLAHDVATGVEDEAHLGVMEVIRRGDVHDLDAVVAEQLLEAAVASRETELTRARGGPLRARCEDAVHVHAEATKGLDVHGPDEAAADDGGPDLARGPHALGRPGWREGSGGNCTR